MRIHAIGAQRNEYGHHEKQTKTWIKTRTKGSATLVRGARGAVRGARCGAVLYVVRAVRNPLVTCQKRCNAEEIEFFHPGGTYQTYNALIHTCTMQRLGQETFFIFGTASWRGETV